MVDGGIGAKRSADQREEGSGRVVCQGGECLTDWEPVIGWMCEILPLGLRLFEGRVGGAAVALLLDQAAGP